MGKLLNPSDRVENGCLLLTNWAPKLIYGRVHNEQKWTFSASAKLNHLLSLF